MVYFVRTAGPKDAETIRALIEETFHDSYDDLYGADRATKMIDEWHSLAAIRDRISKPGGEFLVADSGKDIGGMGYAAMYPKMAKTAMLHHLYVRPSAQGEGIGRDIFAELETCFPDAEIMRLEVAVENTRAISFYARLGFVEVDKVTDCGGPGSGLPAVLMEKRLEL